MLFADRYLLTFTKIQKTWSGFPNKTKSQNVGAGAEHWTPALVLTENKAMIKQDRTFLKVNKSKTKNSFSVKSDFSV